MSPKPRFGEHVLYRIAKTVILGKSEARWRHGVWLGTIPVSDEHIIGTEKGVIKCRAVTTLSEDKRFEAKAVESIRGTPWRPAPRFPGTRIRTHIKDEDQ